MQQTIQIETSRKNISVERKKKLLNINYYFCNAWKNMEIIEIKINRRNCIYKPT